MKLASLGLLTLLAVSIVSAEDELNNHNQTIRQRDGRGHGFFGEFGSEDLAFYAPVSEHVENEVCRAHSRRFLQGLREKEHWAIKMFDASSKLPAGILEGNLMSLGNFDECLSVENVAHPQGDFSGRYCTVSLGSGFFSTLHIYRILAFPHLRNLSGRLESLSNDLPAIIREFGATVSVCIPSSCSHRDLELHLRNDLRSVPKDVSISVQELSCSSRADDVHLSLADWMAILVIASLFSLILAGTFYEVFLKESGSATSLLEAFSLCSNTRSLLKMRSPSEDQLESLDFLRVFSAISIFLAHFHITVVATPIENIVDYTETIYGWVGFFLYRAVGIDTFFLLSGVLIAYNYLKDRENKKDFDVVHFYIHRFIRLTPCYAAVVLLHATVLIYSGDGPSWKPNVQIFRDECLETWAHTLLYIHNYFPIGESLMSVKCMPEGWYLSVNMQLYWLSPLLLYPLWRWPRFGKLLVQIMIIFGLVIAFAISYIQQYKVTAITITTDYIFTHTRFTPWLMGVGLGYLLHSTRSRTYNWQGGGILLGSILMAASIYPGPFFLSPDYVYDTLTTSLYQGFMRSTWTLGVALIIFSCARGSLRSLNAYFAAPLIQILSRLSYTFYLIQLLVLRLFYLTRRKPMHYTSLSMLLEASESLIINFAAAYVLYVAVEAPSAALERMWSKKSSSKPEEKSQ